MSSENGYLAENFNEHDLFLGLKKVLNCDMLYLNKTSREIGMKYLTKKVISKLWQKTLK